MKNITVVLFLFISVIVSAQETTFDSIAIVKKDSTWYLKRISVFDNGGEDYTLKPVGDSLAMLNYLSSMTFDMASQLSASAALVVKKGQTVKLINAYNKALEAAGFISAVDNIEKLIGDEFVGNWKFVNNGTLSNVEVFKNDAGVLKLKINNTNKTLTIFARNWIRIQAYPVAGESLDLYLISPGVYSDINKQVIIKK